MIKKDPNAYFIGVSLGTYILSIIYTFINSNIFQFVEIGKIIIVLLIIKFLDFLLDGAIKNESVNLGVKNFFRFLAAAAFIYFGVMLNIHLLDKFIPYLKTFFEM